ncbi:MAG: PH domain-containing protein [Actinomycetota bacterium]
MSRRGFPMSQLASNEDVVLHLSPHWIALVKPVAQTVLILGGLVLTWLFLPLRWGDWPYILTFLATVILLLVFPVRPFIAWATTHIVVTTHRVIRKSRWIGMHWVEISLDKVNDVHYTQNVLERVVRAGDISIESAGKAGQEVFKDMPDPGRIQRLLSEMKGAGAARPRPGQLSVADELTKLRDLHDDGLLTDAEFRLVKERILERA